MLLAGMVQILWDTNGSFVKTKLSIQFTIWPEITQKRYTWMLIVSLFVIAKNCKQTRCLSMGELLNKMWCIHTKEKFH